MKRNIFILAVLGLIVFGALNPVFAWSRNDFGRAGEERPMIKPPAEARSPIEGLARALNLTSEQKTKLLEQDQALERELLPLRQKIETMRMKLDEEMGKDKPDRRQIESYIKDINQNMLQIQLKRTDFMLRFRETLTPEQKAKLKALAQKEIRKFKR